MNRGFQRNISPKAAAIVILVVLAGVQAWWWRAFIWRPRSPGGVSSGPMSPMPPGPQLEMGRKDVYVETISGAAEPGFADGPGRDARFDAPAGIAIGPDGTIYVADSRNHRIRAIGAGGVTTTIAGLLEGAVDGPAGVARFSFPCGLAVSASGDIYVADTGNHRIRVISGGQVRTLAGGEQGFRAGAGAAARFDSPTALAILKGTPDVLVVADYNNRRIRKVTLEGVADEGTLCPGRPMSVSGGADWEAAAPDEGAIFWPGGALKGIVTMVERIPVKHPGVSVRLSRPAGPDGAETAHIVADAGQGAVLLVRGGAAEVLAGGCQEPGHMLAWRDFSGEQARFGRIGGIAVGRDGRLWVSDTDANSVRRVTVPELLRQQDAEEPSARRGKEPIR